MDVSSPAPLRNSGVNIGSLIVPLVGLFAGGVGGLLFKLWRELPARQLELLELQLKRASARKEAEAAAAQALQPAPVVALAQRRDDVAGELPSARAESAALASWGEAARRALELPADERALLAEVLRASIQARPTPGKADPDT